MKLVNWCVLLLLFYVLMVQTGSAGQENLENGKSIFDKKCSMCHGTSGEGKASVARLYKVEMRPFTSKEVQSNSDEEFEKIITDGKGKMRAVSLKSNEIADVITFIRSLAKKQP